MKPQIPVAIPISIQPVIPTVLIQPTEYVMNTSAQPSNVYITNMNQPMYLNMETMVSNHTVMSSSQFVNGMSYSATTTQVLSATPGLFRSVDSVFVEFMRDCVKKWFVIAAQHQIFCYNLVIYELIQTNLLLLNMT